MQVSQSLILFTSRLNLAFADAKITSFAVMLMDKDNVAQLGVSGITEQFHLKVFCPTLPEIRFPIVSYACSYTYNDSTKTYDRKKANKSTKVLVFVLFECKYILMRSLMIYRNPNISLENLRYRPLVYMTLQ